MKLKIYQIDTEKAANLAFISYSVLKKISGSEIPDGNNYILVFEGEVDATDLEDVYGIFNDDFPEDYMGRSMSVSDVVEVVEQYGETEAGFYYCDTLGFERVEFINPPVSPEKIRVLVIEPGKEPVLKEMKFELSELQKEVGGLIEIEYPFDDLVAVIENHGVYGKGLTYNRTLRDDDGKAIFIIVGTFIIVGYDRDMFVSLSDEQAAKYTEMFKTPETF